MTPQFFRPVPINTSLDNFGWLLKRRETAQRCLVVVPNATSTSGLVGLKWKRLAVDAGLEVGEINSLRDWIEEAVSEEAASRFAAPLSVVSHDVKEEAHRTSSEDKAAAALFMLLRSFLTFPSRHPHCMTHGLVGCSPSGGVILPRRASWSDAVLSARDGMCQACDEEGNRAHVAARRPAREGGVDETLVVHLHLAAMAY